MFGKLRYGVAILSGASIGAGVVVPLEAKSPQPSQSTTGFPLGQPVRTPMPLPKGQLVTRGHADDKEEIAPLFQAYMFYHDTHNGPGVASLFAKDGALENLWNNAGKTIEPNAGPTGRGCFLGMMRLLRCLNMDRVLADGVLLHFRALSQSSDKCYRAGLLLILHRFVPMMFQLDRPLLQRRIRRYSVTMVRT